MASCIVEKSKRALKAFRTSETGNTVVTFALLTVPLVTAVGAAVDYSQANSMRSSMQAAADSTALALVSQAGTLTSTQISSKASAYFLANFNRPTAQNVSVSATYDSASVTLTISASAVYNTTFMGIVGIHSSALSSTSAATLAGKLYTVCIMITDPTDGHTEITSNGAGLVYNNCMNQVNTNNWDAVQADDNSYITGTNSDNCFVGNIHFGNVTPAKDPSCTLFPDPFASYTMPASAKSCDYGNPPAGSTKSAANKAMPAPTTTTYSPGTYCGNVNISPANGSNVTLNPGVYIINAGTLTMKNNINVTATGVTILLTGNNAGLNFQNVNLNMTPSTSAGDFSNFLFFLDQSGCTTQKGALQCPFQSQSQWTNVTMNSNGIIYLVNQEFDVNGCTKSCTGGSQNITLNPGSVIAGSLVPSGNVVFSVTGYPTYSAGAPGQLQKTSNSASNPRLIR